MQANVIILPISTMLKYAQKNKTHNTPLIWKEILELEKRPRVTLIEVRKDDPKSDEVLASLSWGWNGEEIRLAKIEVSEPFRENGIGNVLMSMLFSIAQFYGCKRITGVMSGPRFLREWYEKLGFEIHEENKLLMRFDA